jgi:hypothetical protein
MWRVHPNSPALGVGVLISPYEECETSDLISQWVFCNVKPGGKYISKIGLALRLSLCEPLFLILLPSGFTLYWMWGFQDYLHRIHSLVVKTHWRHSMGIMTTAVYFIPILWGTWSCNRPQADLARFGYRLERIAFFDLLYLGKCGKFRFRPLQTWGY